MQFFFIVKCAYLKQQSNFGAPMHNEYLSRRRIFGELLRWFQDFLWYFYGLSNYFYKQAAYVKPQKISSTVRLPK